MEGSEWEREYKTLQERAAGREVALATGRAKALGIAMRAREGEVGGDGA